MAERETVLNKTKTLKATSAFSKQNSWFESQYDYRATVTVYRKRILILRCIQHFVDKIL